jgi:hypothetical protein
MKKTLLCALTLFFTYALWAGSQITVFNSLGKLNLNKFNLKVNIFPNEKILKLNKESELRICESVDNSNLIIFGPQTPSKVLKKIFDSSAINNSIKELINRGGIIFFGTTSWKNLVSLPKSLIKFYRNYNVPVIGAKMYSTLKNKAGKNTYMKGSPNQNYRCNLLLKPNNLFKESQNSKEHLMAVRYFSNLPKDKFDILFYYKTPEVPLLIKTKSLPGGGAIIFTYCYNIFRQTSHPFIENLVWKAYGPRKRLSGKEQIRKRLSSPKKSKLKEISVPILTLKGKNSSNSLKVSQAVKLYNWRKKCSPQKATDIQVSSDEDNLYVTFLCKEPNIKGVIAKRSRQDSDIWNDDCAELLISSLDKGSDKYHYIINSIGTFYDAKNDNPKWNSKFKLTTKRNLDSWQVNVAIPFSELNLTDRNCFKINFCREEKQHGELTSWSKSLKFTNPLTFGYITTKGKENLLEKLAKGNTKSSNGEIIIRRGKPWSRCYNDSFPKKQNSQLEAQMLVARNEKEAISFWISNTYDKNLYYRIEPDIYLCGTQIPFQKVFTLKSAIPWQATTGEIFAEPLVKLNEANILVLPGLETRSLWLEAKTKIPAGNYKWQFSLVPVNADMPTKKITINLKVLPLTFPSQLPVEIYTFGPYGFSWARGKELKEEYWQTCADYHINWIQGVEGPANAINRDSKGRLNISTNMTDYESNEMKIQKMNLKCVFGYGIYTHFITRLKRLGEKRTIKSPEIQEAFRKWFSTWIKSLKQRRLNFDNALFPLCDEPRSDVIDELVIAGKIMHEVEPRVKIPSTIATWSTLNDIKKLNEVLDVWVTWEPRITSRQNAKEELRFLQNTGKKIRPYLCSTSGNTASYLDYFRYRGIKSHLLKCDGYSMWAFNSWRGNDWKSAEDKKQGGAWLFQHGDNGPIPTIRAEAFREGVEDLYLLRLADGILKKKPNKKLKDLVNPARLNSMLKNSDPIATQLWRDKLISTISDIKSK